jgi:hypothetical protein
MPVRVERESGAVVPDGAAASGCGGDPTTETQSREDPQADWSGNHSVDLRITIPLPFGRYYVTVVAGKERRSSARLQRERKKHPLATAGNIAALFLLGCVSGLAALYAIQFVGAAILWHLDIAVLS